LALEACFLNLNKYGDILTDVMATIAALNRNLKAEGILL